ncbi:MAG: hypothetical protein J5942_01225 [Prevotella sp.]|nr:hypothetical protein [Prevotella sp.]
MESKKEYISPVTEAVAVPELIMLTGASDGNGTGNNFKTEEIIEYQEVIDGDFARSTSIWDTDWGEDNSLYNRNE